MIELSIVIASFESRDLLEGCLRSIYTHAPPFGFEIIVVDNGSTDGSPELVQQRFPEVRLLRNSRNLGYARACNQGLRAAKGEFLLLVNSDTILKPKTLEETVSFLQQHPEVGVVSPRVLNADGSVQSTAKGFPRPIHMFFGRLTLLTRWFPQNPISRRYLLASSAPDDRPLEVDYVTGAYFLTRRAVVERVGYLDQAMWMYWEDADWCRRIKGAGWKVLYYPRVEVVHLEGGSSHRDRARLIYWFHRSIFLYYRKHHLRTSWHPLAWLAAAALATRAGALMTREALARRLRDGKSQGERR